MFAVSLFTLCGYPINYIVTITPILVLSIGEYMRCSIHLHASPRYRCGRRISDHADYGDPDYRRGLSRGDFVASSGLRSKRKQYVLDHKASVLSKAATTQDRA